MRRIVATMLRFFGLSLALSGVRARPVARILNAPVVWSIIELGTFSTHSSVPAAAVWTASSSTV